MVEGKYVVMKVSKTRLFGLPMALLLRSGINVTASLYTVVCNVVYDKLHGKRAEIAENLVKP